MSRGQTTIDFVVGMSVFLLTVAMIFLFVPGIIDPFATGGEGHAVTANRAVTNIATHQLSEPDSPYILNESDTSAFFNRSEDTIKNQLGLSDSRHINVTLVKVGGSERALGPSPPSYTSVTTAWRVVYVDGKTAELTVRVW